ncbi:hypothetical protein VNI00_013898 [Paramarasmius palmivorus]|uniref:ATP synthase F0 subunit 8 n=1 Tax=Paramarasmius palmivorus TaxID=297713 RepID=A0AAW0BY15_9AGAR
MPVLASTLSSIASPQETIAESRIANVIAIVSTTTDPKILLLLLLAGTFYLITPPIFRWRFPCRTPGELETHYRNLYQFIDANSYLERDIIENYTGTFKAPLDLLKVRVNALVLHQYREPRVNPFAWVQFKWKLLWDVDSCYGDLRDLELRVKEAIHNALF